MQRLQLNKISKYKIVVEPAKRNTAPAILSTALIKDIPDNQPLMFFTADYYEFKKSFMQTISNKIVNNIRGINRVVYDVTSKPPSTIELE